MNNLIERIWKQGGLVNIEDLRGTAFQAEESAHTFRIRGVDESGEPLALTGTCAAIFMRADNTDVAITGTITDGAAEITLTDECYDMPGRFGLTIYVTSDEQTVAVYAAIGSVCRTSSGVVSPETGEDVMDLINAIAEAVATIPASYTDLMAAVAPTYSTSALYAVGSYAWYDGKLYRCTTAITSGETWTSAHWTQANLGSDVSDLKSAITQKGVLSFPVKGVYNTSGQFEQATSPYYTMTTKKINANGITKVEGTISFATSTRATVFIMLWKKDGTLSRVTLINQDTTSKSFSYDIDNTISEFALLYNSYGTATFEAKCYGSDGYELSVSEEEALKMLGCFVERTYNIWDEQWELGTINTAASGTGNQIYGTSNLRCKNFIPILPNTEYYYNRGNISANFTIFYYDSDYKYISYTTAGNSAKTSPSNAAYIMFFMATGYGTTYNHDISICLNSAENKEKYMPYYLPKDMKARYAIEDIKSVLLEYMQNIPRTSAEVSTYLPDLNNVGFNTYHTIRLYHDYTNPSHLPTYFFYNDGDLIYIETLAAHFVGNDFYMFTQNIYNTSGEVLWTRSGYKANGSDTRVWGNWINASPLTFTVGDSSNFSTLYAACEAAYTLKNITLEIKRKSAGAYDLINELGANLTTSYQGLPLGNGMVLKFDPDVSVVCDYEGGNSTIADNFSAFFAKNGDFIIDGMNISCKNVRYCVHDEIGGYQYYAKHEYRNCNMSIDNSASPSQTQYYQCIGGGLGKETNVIVEHCVFDSVCNAGDPVVSYHNTNHFDNAASKVTVRDNYFKHGTIRAGYYGTQTEKTVFIACGNSVESAPYKIAENAQAQVDNIDFYAWGNVVR